MKVVIVNKQRDMKISHEKKSIRGLCSLLLQNEKIETDELAIFFVTDKEMRKLHQQFFNDPSPTDCITIPVDTKKDLVYSVLGTLFICPKTALSYANKHKINAYEELYLYIIHGLLHLAGYDDILTKDRKIMRKKEALYMNLIFNGILKF